MPLAKCKQGLIKCFACDSNGRCHALENTDFNTALCPFYKTSEQVKKELNYCAERVSFSPVEYRNILKGIFEEYENAEKIFE